MIKKTRILILEDQPTDAELAMRELQSTQLSFEFQRVETKEAFLKAIREFAPDIILSDFSLPQFNALDALSLLKEHKIETPFILYTGSLTEEVAVECMKEGAEDYILKSSLKRLPSAILNVLEKSESRRAKEEAINALRESEARYRLLFDHNPYPMWVYDLESLRFLAVNNRAISHYGYSREEFLEMTIKDIRPVEDIPAFLQFIEKRYETDSEIIRASKHKKKDGTIIEVESTSHSIDFVGKRARLVLVTDITERKRTEKALLESEERLRQSQKMEAIGTLTGGVAHDFNNLLTAILGNTQLALRKLHSSDPLQPHLLEVEKASNRAAILTRQLLAFSRRQHLERRNININQTISEIIKLLQRIIGEDVEISVKYTSDLSVVFADPAQIEQVVMNLCVNARDAMPNGGQLTIETSNTELDESYCQLYPYVQPGKYVQIRVSDNGTGIDAETQTRIFEPFFTTKEIGKGTGLGLSMVYGIVKQHDGHINIYSELGYGTTFKIFLPVVEMAIEEKTQTTQPSLLGGTEMILVAEDEETLRILSKDILESLGYTVLLAKNGKEAIEIFLANREQINLLLFDVVMPQVGGSEAYERIRAAGGDIPMIFMTGYSSETVQSRFVNQNKMIENLGATVIPKPYSVEGLGRKVREVLDIHQNGNK